MVNALDSQGMTRQFYCAVSGVPETVLLDSGAVEPCISAAYARMVGIKVEQRKVARSSGLPDGSSVSVLGRCHVMARIPPWTASVPCLVVDLTEGSQISLILVTFGLSRPALA